MVAREWGSVARRAVLLRVACKERKEERKKRSREDSRHQGAHLLDIDTEDGVHTVLSVPVPAIVNLEIGIQKSIYANLPWASESVGQARAT